jgi:hypothetical protein
METTMTWTWSEMNCSATSYGPPVYLSPGEEVYLAIPRTLANGGGGGGGGNGGLRVLYTTLASSIAESLADARLVVAFITGSDAMGKKTEEKKSREGRMERRGREGGGGRAGVGGGRD